MKKLALMLLVICGLAVGCAPSTVFVRALEPPKWDVYPYRSIGVVAVVENKHGLKAQLTRDLAAVLRSRLLKSAYYVEAAGYDLLEGNFEMAEGGERIPLQQTIAESAEETGTDIVLYVEVLDAARVG